MSTNSAPLLSICIPTYSRAAFLDVCLASVLPQVAQTSGLVECVICDNASTDHTQQIIRKYAGQFRLVAERNASNVGVIANIHRVIGELAKGQFIWQIGDDDCLTAGAVARIVKLLAAQSDLGLVALNVGFRSEDRRPSAESAWGGIATEAEHYLRAGTLDGIMPFETLLEGPCADFTASYSSVLRRSLWLEYYQNAAVIVPFQSVESAYPHAAVIANRMPGRNAGAIATASVMVYELPGEQYSWARYRALCVLLFSTQLLRMYERAGVPRSRLAAYYRYTLQHRALELGDLIWNPQTAGGWLAALRFMMLNLRYPILLSRAFLIAMTHPQAPQIVSSMVRWLWSGKQKMLRKTSA